MTIGGIENYGVDFLQTNENCIESNFSEVCVKSFTKSLITATWEKMNFYAMNVIYEKNHQ